MNDEINMNVAKTASKKKTENRQSRLQMDGSDWGQSRVSVAGWPQNCWQRKLRYLNTFRLHALLNATEIVLYNVSAPPQPTSNTTLLADNNKKGPQWRLKLLIQK